MTHVYMKNTYHFAYKGGTYSLVFTICQKKKKQRGNELEKKKKTFEITSMKIELTILNFRLPTVRSKANGEHI